MNLLHAPLETIDALYQQHRTLPFSELIEQYISFFQTQLPQIKDQIPFITQENVYQLQPNQLVRFKCMIQDIWDEEYFQYQYALDNNQFKTSLFRETIQISDQDELMMDDYSIDNIAQRSVYYAVAIPGETSWAKQMYLPHSSLSSPLIPISTNKKRNRKEETEEEEESVMETDATSSDKKIKVTHQETGSKKIKVKDNPLPQEQQNICCILKCYQSTMAEQIKLCDPFIVTGILCIDNTSDEEITDEFTDKELGVISKPPSSLVPRIHCLSVEKCNSLAPFSPTQTLPLQFSSEQIMSFRSKVVHYLSRNACRGDIIAAEYLLLHLISKVYSRNNILPMGKFVLGFENVTQTMLQQLQQTIALLVPNFFCLDMSIQTLMNLDFYPKKNYEANKLNSGILQLAHGTYLMINELTMSEGKLDGKALQNINALQGIIQTQQLVYDFTFNSIQCPTDLNILVLSQGKSLFVNHLDMVIAIKENTTATTSFSKEEEEELLPLLRFYLHHVRNYQSYEFNDALKQSIERDFVRLRSQNKNITPEHLHLWLTLARYYAMSCLQSSCTESMWNTILKLDASWRERNSNQK